MCPGGRELIGSKVARRYTIQVIFPSWFFPVILLQTFASPIASVLRDQIISMELRLIGSGLATSL
jgi:hypothetical protein